MREKQAAVRGLDHPPQVTIEITDMCSQPELLRAQVDEEGPGGPMTDRLAGRLGTAGGGPSKPGIAKSVAVEGSV